MCCTRRVRRDERGKYSDTDLHVVYTSEGVDAWSADLVPMMNNRFQIQALPQMIQHPPQDNWSDRNRRVVQVNNASITNGNYGPQPPATAYLPYCTAVQLPD